MSSSTPDKCKGPVERVDRAICIDVNSLPAAVDRHERQKREVPGALDRDRQLPLDVRGAVRLTPRQDLAALVDREAQARDVLVIDHFVVREDRLLAARRTSAATTAASTAKPAPRSLAGGTSAESRRPLAVAGATRTTWSRPEPVWTLVAAFARYILLCLGNLLGIVHIRRITPDDRLKPA